MISNTWIERRKPEWERLQGLLTRCGQVGTQALTRQELRDLGLLYRQVAADLSVTRRDPSATQYSRYLNQLLGRAHNTIYSGKKTSLRQIPDFLARSWPVMVWRLRGYVLVAAGVFLLFGIAGALVTLQNPDFALQVLGPRMVRTIQEHKMWTTSIVSVKPLAASSIATNNLTVTFSTFAMGVTAGLGTLYLLAFNGLLMGVVGTACALHGLSLSLWSFVAGHGSLEIPAILFSGGAGLRLATGILFPGRLRRSDALKLAAREAIQLELGCIPLLLVAGTVEGFFSPSPAPPWEKFALGMLLFSFLLTWITLGSKAARAASLQGTD